MYVLSRLSSMKPIRTVVPMRVRMLANRLRNSFSHLKASLERLFELLLRRLDPNWFARAWKAMKANPGKSITGALIGGGLLYYAGDKNGWWGGGSGGGSNNSVGNVAAPDNSNGRSDVTAVADNGGTVNITVVTQSTTLPLE